MNTDQTEGPQVFDTPEAIAYFRATAIAHGAALYLNTGMRPNRAYTPTRMRDALNGITGAKARNLKAALAAYVEGCDEIGHEVAATVRRASGVADPDHGPGCDGPLNCTCEQVR